MASTVWPDEQPVVRFQPLGAHDAVVVDLRVLGAKLQIGDGVIECATGQPSADDLRRFARELSDRVGLAIAAPQQKDEPDAPGF